MIYDGDGEDGKETLDCLCSRVYKVAFWHHVCVEKLSGEEGGGLSKFKATNNNQIREKFHDPHI